jgi:hypothetical protein
MTSSPTLPVVHHQLGEIGRPFGPAREPDRALLQLAIQPADRRSQVLRLKRLHNLGDADTGCLQRLRLKLDRHFPLDIAHDAHLGHSRDRSQRAGHAGIGQPAQRGGRHGGRGKCDRYDGLLGGIEPGEHRLLHLDWEVIPFGGDGVPDIL